MLEIRVDDFPGTKPEEFGQHNIDNFLKFHRCMEDVGHPRYVLGVIPHHCNERDYLELKKLPIEIAMHGVTHDETRLNEFEWVADYQIGLVIGSTLKELREHFRVDTYIPPHNSIDKRTVGSLWENGIKRIMGGPGSDLGALKYARDLGIDTTYSMEGLEYGRTDEMLQRRAIDHIVGKLRHDSENPNVCLTLHWPWEWNIGLDHMRVFFDALHARLSS